MVEWETWYTTTDTLYIITSDNPVTCALYSDEKKITTVGMEMILINSKASKEATPSGKTG